MFYWPSTLDTRQRITVKMTKIQFQSWGPATVETPRKMKISVSLTLLHIFRKYLMVVYDLWEMLASTYGRITTPQAINLFETGWKQVENYGFTDTEWESVNKFTVKLHCILSTVTTSGAKHIFNQTQLTFLEKLIIHGLSVFTSSFLYKKWTFLFVPSALRLSEFLLRAAVRIIHLNPEITCR